MDEPWGCFPARATSLMGLVLCPLLDWSQSWGSTGRVISGLPEKLVPCAFGLKLLRVCLGTCPLGWGEHEDEDLALVGTDPRPEPDLPPFFPFC